MDILQVLGLVLLVASPCLSTGPPSQDYWGKYGPYGPCSHTCGTGVAVRTRTCITTRTDGGHDCVGSSKSYSTCKFEPCSRDVREEQCSQFDDMEFEGKRYTWLPYYGAYNPCELNCSPRGENFFYTHSPRVVDGTPCYRGHTDICVEGVCRALSRGKLLDPAPAPAPSAHLRETLSYAYTYGAYSECSAPCDGGMQTRSVQCVTQGVAPPRVVDERHCIDLALQRPASQRACNMQACAKYTASSFSACSVSCGEGQQTREVYCVGAGGNRLDDASCRGLARPPSVQACRKPACHIKVGWHVTDFGLCSRSCGGGVKKRRVECLDSNLNPYSEDRCRAPVRPPTVATCNTQACPEDRAYGGTVVYDPYIRTVVGPHCVQSYYGCCPDGHTPAIGPRQEGCPVQDCLQSRYGCCLDGVTAAQGFARAGCPELSPTMHQSGAVCSLPRDEGSCDNWTSRIFFNTATGKCTHFWFGGCHGNGNNFASMAECQRSCPGAPAHATPPRRPLGAVRGGVRRNV